jgi:hypothetical protein
VNYKSSSNSLHYPLESQSGLLGDCLMTTLF